MMCVLISFWRFNQCNQWYIYKERWKSFTRFDKKAVEVKLFNWYQDQEILLSWILNNLQINTLSLTNTLKILVFFRYAV